MLKDRITLNKALRSLPVREQNVLRLRYGLDDGECRSVEELSKEFNVSPETIREIEEAAINELRNSESFKVLCKRLKED